MISLNHLSASSYAALSHHITPSKFPPPATSRPHTFSYIPGASPLPRTPIQPPTSPTPQEPPLPPPPFFKYISTTRPINALFIPPRGGYHIPLTPAPACPPAFPSFSPTTPVAPTPPTPTCGVLPPVALFSASGTPAVVRREGGSIARIASNLKELPSCLCCFPSPSAVVPIELEVAGEDVKLTDNTPSATANSSLVESKIIFPPHRYYKATSPAGGSYNSIIPMMSCRSRGLQPFPPPWMQEPPAMVRMLGGGFLLLVLGARGSMASLGRKAVEEAGDVGIWREAENAQEWQNIARMGLTSASRMMIYITLAEI